jgi:signal transduction histidine kinase
LSGSAQELINLFIRPPANSVYFVITVVLCLVSLLMVIGHEAHRSQGDHYRRYSFALGLVVLSWVLPLIIAIFSLANNTPVIGILPPLERFTILITLSLTMWMFAPPYTAITRFTQIVFIAGVVALVITVAQWTAIATQTDFNLSTFAIWWTFAHSLLAILGVLLMIRHFITVEDSPLKLVFFVIFGVGAIFTLIQTAQGNLIGNDAGGMRMSMVIGLFLLPMLIYRDIVRDYQLFLIDAKNAPAPQLIPPPIEPAPISPAMRESVQLLRALGVMLDSTTSTLPQAILKAVIDMVKVDVAALLRFKDANYADVVVAYDRIFEREFSGMSINLNQQPTLVNSVERRSQRSLLPDRNYDELRDLYTRLDIEAMGPAYFQPLSKDNQVISVLMIALPYTMRELTKAEESLLQGIAVIAANLLQLAYVAQDAQMMAEENAIQQMVNRALNMQPVNDAERKSRQNLQAELDLARQQIANLNSEIETLKSAVNKEQKRVSDELSESQEGLSVSQKMVALNTNNEALRRERDELIHKLQQAEVALHAALNTSDENRYQDYIEGLRREKASLEAQKIALQVQLDELRANDRVIMPSDFKDMLDRMILERDELVKERDSLELRLNAVNEQLSQIGVEQGIDGLVLLVSRLTDQRSELQTQNTTLQTNLAALLAEHERLQNLREQEQARDNTIQALQKELQNLANDREAALRQRDMLQAEFDAVKNNLKVFKAKWAQLQAQADAYAKELQKYRQQQSPTINGQPIIQEHQQHEQTEAIAKYTTENADLLLALIQELRTPMTSITGYVDLLLSEASGILGEMQRKFLQRVATNVNRLGLMLDDLIQITELDTGHLSFKPAPINIGNLIEDIITNTALHFREKGLTVNLSVQDNIPEIEADRDAIEQVFMQLLNNAFLVSPPNSQIGIRASKRQASLNGDDKIDCLLVTIEDKGGGIAEEDIPRVFARKYKAQNPLIAGLGDTGVGLSVAKALIEAQNGRLWVESQMNVGSRFSFLLPINPMPIAPKAMTNES